MGDRRVKVATVITRMAAGAGGVSLRGALALDPHRYDITVIAGGHGITGAADTPGASRGVRGTPEPTVLVGTDAVDDAPRGDLLLDAFKAGLQVMRVSTLVPQISPRRDAATRRTLTQLLAEGGYDVVHTHSAKAGALGRIAASRAGVARIVHTFHGFPFHEFQPRWLRAAYVRAERYLARRTHAFLAVGSAVAAQAIRLGLAPPDGIRTIPPAVDSADLQFSPAARGLARRRLGLPTGVRLVGTVGRVDYQKAPELWIDALAATGDDVWGVWIGDGPLREQLLARARKRGVADRFCLLGHREDVADLLPAFDVFALASRYEGLPCVLIEAIGAGVPVVATAVNAVPEVVVPGETGLLVPPGTAAPLGRAIRYLLEEPAEAARMARTARERLDQRYTPQTLGAALDHTYRGRSTWN
ncbi:glycosyltransferase [Dactylosporangium fulvum]|uniref:Glycosyltransferase n=1 Tax=Dactylosporangium fulvum TaxID=53359 RepID=A0ABY5W9Y4_9ACTN|nr:glycosyltransferase [Dactylosporangium fulvum]UWP85498.1 glycosyltransferase [Dactylosporangium fulvum]